MRQLRVSCLQIGQQLFPADNICSPLSRPRSKSIGLLISIFCVLSSKSGKLANLQNDKRVQNGRADPPKRPFIGFLCCFLVRLWLFLATPKRLALHSFGWRTFSTGPGANNETFSLSFIHNFLEIFHQESEACPWKYRPDCAHSPSSSINRLVSVYFEGGKNSSKIGKILLDLSPVFVLVCRTFLQNLQLIWL